MMDLNAKLRLQAHLDGELSGRKARRVEQWLASDGEAQMLAEELRRTKNALAGNEPTVCVPETREFYWSKIQREIERQRTQRPAPFWGKMGVRWKRVFLPALSAACVAIVAGLAVRHFGTGPSTGRDRCEVVAALSDSGAVTYRDHAAGVTLVWLSYPSQN